MLHECQSGQELIERGWAEDVRLATEGNVTTTIPVLRDGAYHRLEST